MSRKHNSRIVINTIPIATAFTLRTSDLLGFLRCNAFLECATIYSLCSHALVTTMQLYITIISVTVAPIMFLPGGIIICEYSFSVVHIQEVIILIKILSSNSKFNYE